MIDPYLFSAKFPERCRLDLCRSQCCRSGVWVDIAEKEVILAHQDLFTPYLRPEARALETWFGQAAADPDCPSGLAVETQEIGGACSLFHPDHGCVLQKGATVAGLHQWSIKPRFCIMFPLLVSGGELRVDEHMTGLWCMAAENRTRPILDAVRREMAFLLDDEQLRKLYARQDPFPATRP